MRRNLGALRSIVLDYRASGQGSDARITTDIQTRLDQAEAVAAPTE